MHLALVDLGTDLQGHAQTGPGVGLLHGGDQLGGIGGFGSFHVEALQVAAKASNAAELIAAMQQAYPRAGLGVALEIGAKVNKGEMQW